jgi:predicted dehydrogenase
MKRRTFLQQSSLATSGLMVQPMLAQAPKTKLALVGTGVRAVTMWGASVKSKYNDFVDFVGLCDINPGRLETAQKMMRLSCPTFINFEEMMTQTRPEVLLVTSVDDTHDEFIIKGMEMGADIITEKPMTTDARKCQAILEAQQRTGRKITVTFNYRYSPHRQKIWELLRQGAIGQVTSVDFHWYLDTSHGADYFRRWHRLREKSGTLLVHKASHHFDLLNWWLDAEPTEVYARGSLDFYGKNGQKRGPNCRNCTHQTTCPFYWNIAKNPLLHNLYIRHEHHDGYLRDGCVFDEKVNIYDKMGAVIQYHNGVQATYSLTAYSPYEGYRIAFNGTGGRLEAWIQESGNYDLPKEDELWVYPNFGKVQHFKIPQAEGHGGGDDRMKDFIFKTPQAADTYRQSAGVLEGALAVLTGIAARQSIETGRPVTLASLTSLQPGKR